MSLLQFDGSIGRFFWRERPRRGWKAGRSLEAGSFDVHGYGQVMIDGKIYKEHHLVWLWYHGEMPAVQIDHLNHQRRDNRIENLRLADNTVNHKNRPMQRNNTTGCVGVSFDRSRYVAYVTVSGKQIRLGRFKTLEEAVEARQRANREYGFHQNHGIGYGRSKHKPIKSRVKKSA